MTLPAVPVFPALQKPFRATSLVSLLVASLFMLQTPVVAATPPTDSQISTVAVGGTGTDRGMSIAVDGAGNTVTTGIFRDTADFDPGVGVANLTPQGDDDVFVTKLNSAGELVWAKSFGGTSGDRGHSVAVDATGNVYVSGEFEGVAGFGATSLTSAGEVDVFVAKLDSSGAVVWAKGFGGTSGDRGQSVAVDATGNVYVSGEFEDVAGFGATSLTSAGDEDVFVTKLDSSGAVVWAKNYGGADEDRGYSVAVDATGNSFVSGTFENAAGFGATSLTSAGDVDVFVTKLDSSGAVVWARNYGGADEDRGYSVAVDSSGNLYLTGDIRAAAAFGATSLTSAGGTDVFVAKLDSSGAVVWAKGFGGTSADRGYSVAVDSRGNVHVTGQFNETIAFGATSLTSAGGADVFVTTLDSSGAVVWARGFGGTFLDRGYSLAVDASGNLFVAGWFEDTATFGATSLTSAGDWDVFVLTMAVGEIVSSTTTTIAPSTTVTGNGSITEETTARTPDKVDSTLPTTGASVSAWSAVLLLAGIVLLWSSRRRLTADERRK